MESSSLVALGKTQKIFLLIISFVLAAILFVMRIGLNSVKPLDFLARNSLQPELALQNGLPTVLEFYADWCEVCKEMAPQMLTLKNKYQNQIDIVLLNVDNPKWLDLIDKYQVNGIPQLNLFDESGQLKGQLTGLKNSDDLEKIAYSLINHENITKLANIKDDVSKKVFSSEIDVKRIDPRSHG